MPVMAGGRTPRIPVLSPSDVNLTKLSRVSILQSRMIVLLRDMNGWALNGYMKKLKVMRKVKINIHSHDFNQSVNKFIREKTSAVNQNVMA
jgi:hypothetical protein